jgi:hypothetical protein
MAISETIGYTPVLESVLTLKPELGHIRGRVVDANDEAIIGCTICIRETDRTSQTDTNGDFVLINIQPTIYTLMAQCRGYALCAFPKVRIKTGDNPGFRFVMKATPVH